MQLANKVILITGSYSGIGKAIAIKALMEGAKVLINGLEEQLGQSLLIELGTEDAACFTIDITKKEAPKLLVEKAIQQFGHLDAIVNNAARIVSSAIENTDSEFLIDIFRTNTAAPLAIIRAALPQLEKNKGCVLNIGSINAWGGEPHLLAYSISKGALMTMTRNLGDSLFREHGVRVNQINPGWVLTDNERDKKNKEGMKDDWYKDIPSIFAPAKRLFSPEEIAAAATFLLSDNCGPVSAQVLDLEQFPLIGRNLPKSWEGSHN
ncbi:MAG: NAD(P)-dependent dehydrogenase (short-subunit alcohol dehydrogenase family) [Algoriphagus sp.]|jgi:NAD(P)-dependent dehydrogenase (short-subunit alcohol dehydrogenase family)